MYEKGIGISFGDVLDSIVQFKMDKGYSPTLRELADDLECALSTVCEKAKMMKQMGYIDYQEGSSRTITIPGYRYVKSEEGSENG